MLVYGALHFQNSQWKIYQDLQNRVKFWNPNQFLVFSFHTWRIAGVQPQFLIIEANIAIKIWPFFEGLLKNVSNHCKHLGYQFINDCQNIPIDNFLLKLFLVNIVNHFCLIPIHSWASWIIVKPFSGTPQKGISKETTEFRKQHRCVKTKFHDKELILCDSVYHFLEHSCFLFL